jgi:hypothetical protein
MSLPQTIKILSMFPPMMKLPSVKKKIKISRGKHKTKKKKKIKKIQKIKNLKNKSFV